MINTLENLEKIASTSLYGSGVSGNAVKYSFEIFNRYIKKGSILELGPAEGIMTDLIYSNLHKMGGGILTLVDGSSLFCTELKKKYPDVEVCHSLFEDFHTDKKFKTIILGHVLEHVDDPVFILRHVKQFLEEDGVILSAVPNANSIHRQAAVIMGLISDIKAFSELDYHHGHKRVYTIDEFKNDFLLAALTVKEIGGYWLKPLSNSQIEKDWTEEMIMAFMKLGEKYPDIAAEIYIVATLK